MKKLISFLFLFLFCFALPAQKVLKPVRTNLKDKKAEEALKLIVQLEKDSIAKHLPRLYDLGKEAQIMVNDGLNEKIYLKQAYDTVKFFNSTLEIFRYVLKCDREEQRLLAEEGKKMKYNKDNSEILHRYYPNLNAGGRYFYKKGRYSDAMDYFRLYLDLPSKAIWQVHNKKNSEGTSSTAMTNAFLYMKSAYLAKEYEEVERYKALALSDTSALRCTTLEYLSLAAEARKDTSLYRSYLMQGLTEYPGHPFFFSHLADYYADRNAFNSLLHMAEEHLQTDTFCLLALEAKCLALVNLHRYEEVIKVGKESLALDSTHADAYYYVGAAYCNLAYDVKIPTNINTKAYRDAIGKQKEYYRKALPFVEKYRELAPQQTRRWAPLLYNVYFSLNMGKKFDEIERLLK